MPKKKKETEEVTPQGAPLTPPVVTPADSSASPKEAATIPEPQKQGEPLKDSIAAAAQEALNAAPEINTAAVSDSKEKNDQSQPQNKGGRPKGYSPKMAQEEKSRIEQERIDEESTLSGRQSADMMMLIFRTGFGPEWAPDDEKEAEDLRAAWGATYKHYGWNTSPGWMPMVAATGAYAVKRLNRPQTRSKVLGFKEKIASWWAKRQVRKNEPVRKEHEKVAAPE